MTELQHERIVELETENARLAAIIGRQKYKIVRSYFRGGRRTINTGLTLEQAQAHCNDPETSSRTCQKAANVRRTKRMGPWFDGYEVDR